MRDTIHDCYYSIHSIVPNEELITKLCNEIPEYICKEGKYWGWNDTVVRDMIFTYLEKRKVEVND